jgi:hypothetical protein
MTMKVKKLALFVVLGCAATAQEANVSYENATRLARGTRAGVAVQNAVREKELEKATAPAEAPAPAPASMASPSAGTVTPAAAIISTPKRSAPRRDPFISPIVRFGGGGMGPGGSCSVGKRCLMVADLALRGVVRESDGNMIAVVTSSANKTYFLHANDPLYNGIVVRITGDSLVIRESSTDNLGRAVTKEVVKKISSAPAV